MVVMRKLRNVFHPVVEVMIQYNSPSPVRCVILIYSHFLQHHKKISGMYESDSELDDNGSTSKTTSSSLQYVYVITTVSFFLVFFHLTFLLSEHAINTLISFLRALFQYLSVITGHTLLVLLARSFPKTLHAARNVYKEKNVSEYVICPKCSSRYTIDQCILINGESKHCSFVELPNHPHSSKRIPCNETLMKKIKKGGKFKLITKKVYMYRSVITSLKNIAQRKGFLIKCDHWRNRNTGDLMGDIYDGMTCIP